jgi:Mg-chelatase subunit ChlD
MVIVIPAAADAAKHLVKTPAPEPIEAIVDVVIGANGISKKTATFPDGRPGVSVMFVVDVSTSMDLSSVATNVNSEIAHFSRIALIKHALRTCIALMDTEDQVSVITYSTDAKILVPWSNDHKASSAIVDSKLSTGGCTQVWTGLELAYKNAAKDKETHIILLTDGAFDSVYNTTPPRGGWARGMRELHEKNPRTVLSVCGLGPEVSSDILRDLAIEGKGLYTYISDGSMVGNVFVHLVSNIKFARDGIPFYAKTTAPKTTDEPVLPRVSLDFADFLNETIEIALKRGPGAARERLIAYADSSADDVLRDDIYHPSADKGQMCKACDHWDTWGKHYLISTWFAHVHQVKINHKDAILGVAYSSPAFDEYIKVGEDIFSKIPPPKTLPIMTPTPSPPQMSLPPTYTGAWVPSSSTSRGTLFGGPSHPMPFSASGPSASSSRGMLFSSSSHPMPFSASAPTSYNMRNVYNSTSCFSGDSAVELDFGGITCRVDALCKGMKLKGGFTVECITVSKGRALVVEVGPDLHLTPWHPFKRDGKWTQVTDKDGGRGVDVVYNIVLVEKGAVVTSGLIEAATLGPCAELTHSYFNTQAVIDDLRALPGYEDGKVNITQVIRDPFTNLVCKII